MNSAFSRVLNLEGSCNLRDLGGYPTADGRYVRPAVLYRSGVMTYLTEGGKQLIEGLGIRVICDLRRARERNDEPTLWRADGLRVIAVEEDPALESQGELAWRDATSGESARQVMIELYRNMPVWLEGRLRGIFQALAAGEVPLLFHCAAGKDRTGLAAALVLHCLGVERAAILADYALTNEVIDLEQFARAHRKARLGLGRAEHPVLRMSVEARRATMRADVDYLSAALGQIERDYPSIDHYLAERLGVTAALQHQMRNLLLMPPDGCA